MIGMPNPAMTETIGPDSEAWLTAVEAADTVEDADTAVWDDEADLVVVGYGGAGVAAALEGAEQGLDVLAMDRHDGGGSTAINGGVFYAGGGTAIQKKAGVHDTVDEMYKYLKVETRGIVSDKTLRRFCEGSADDLDWLMQHGVEFNERIFWKKTGYPDPRYYLYFSDNSLVPSRAAVARPAPRGHRVFTPPRRDAQYGKYIYDPLRASASRAGVRFMPQTEVTQLIRDGGGRVLGVKVRQIPPNTEAWKKRRKHQHRADRLMVTLPPSFPGARLTYWLAGKELVKAGKIEAEHRKPRRIRARLGVCLSAGGFIYNRPMVHHYAPHHDATAPMGNPGDNGSGIRLGQTVGGAAERLGYIASWRFLNPPAAWVNGVIVNRDARRFVDETMYAATVGYHLNEEEGGVGYLIVDRRINRLAWAELLFTRMLNYQRYPGILTMLFAKKKARTIEGLAKKCGLDPAVLQETVDAYNRAAAGVELDPFKKDQKEMRALVDGPFYAIDISASNTLLPMMAMTLGGLKVDEETGQALNDKSRAIDGLYAAGRAAIGICSEVYMSGLSMADCVFSGRRVGRHVAALRAGQNPSRTADCDSLMEIRS